MAVALGVMGVAVGSIVTPSGNITACLDPSGAARLVDKQNGEHCNAASEREVTWNVTGPTGPKGANGTNGARGPTGATGPQGAMGTKGAGGATGPTGAGGPKGSTGPKGPAGDPGTTGGRGPTGPVGATGSLGPRGATGPGGPSAIKNLIGDFTPVSLGADGAVKYMAFQPISLTRTQRVTVSASGVLGVNAGSAPATFDFGPCSGPTGSGLPTFFDPAGVQAVTVSPGTSLMVTATESALLAPSTPDAGFCIRLNAGVLNHNGRANGVLTVY